MTQKYGKSAFPVDRNLSSIIIFALSSWSACVIPHQEACLAFNSFLLGLGVSQGTGLWPIAMKTHLLLTAIVGIRALWGGGGQVGDT